MAARTGLTVSEEVAKGAGKWSQPGVPHRGWTCVEIEDLGEPLEICAMCEVVNIRFVHHMTHPEYEGDLRCGCVCAGHMEGDYEAAKRRESTAKNAAARRVRWAKRKWNVSVAGNSYLNTDGYNITIYKNLGGKLDGSWGFRIMNRETLASRNSRRPYPTEDAAKLKSFDGLLWMKDKGL